MGCNSSFRVKKFRAISFGENCFQVDGFGQMEGKDFGLAFDVMHNKYESRLKS